MTLRKIRSLTGRSAEADARSAVEDARFWEKTREDGDCLVWTGYRDRQGYGSVMRQAVSPSPIPAHRFAYYLLHGSVPPGVVIRHRCDNPPCVLPDHLLLGSQLDNIADRQARGRHRPGRLNGEAHPAHKLNAAQVMEMRRRFRSGTRLAVIARDYPVRYSTAWQIVHGELWSHLPLDGVIAA